MSMDTTDLVELVESDPHRTGAEKETAFTMLGDEKTFRAMSAKPTVVKSLLKHDECEIQWLGVARDDSREIVRDPADARDVDAIYAVSGDMPVGCLTIKSSPRSNNHQSSIVNSEGIDPDAFASTETEA